MSSLLRSRRDAVPAEPTRDGSRVRELMHPARQGNRAQSLAEAELAPGASTRLHRHRRSEEIYHFLAGRGEMELDGRRFPVQAGDTVCIPPGSPHRLFNTGEGTLRLLCCCAPAYAHDDTELLA